MRRRILLSSTASGGCDDVNCYGGDDGVHDYVEIGGIKWATKNVGACTETDPGWYFAWGETAGYTKCQVGANTVDYAKPFYYEDYKFNGGRSTFAVSGMTKYNSSDGKTTLDLSDDAARLHWGETWRMPTQAEFVALVNAVNTAWTASYNNSGVAGLICTDKNDSSKVLFFPAAGACSNGSVLSAGSGGTYWSSSLSPSPVGDVCLLYFNSSNFSGQNYYGYRYSGRSVRPVLGS